MEQAELENSKESISATLKKKKPVDRTINKKISGVKMNSSISNNEKKKNDTGEEEYFSDSSSSSGGEESDVDSSGSSEEDECAVCHMLERSESSHKSKHSSSNRSAGISPTLLLICDGCELSFHPQCVGECSDFVVYKMFVVNDVFLPAM